MNNAKNSYLIAINVTNKHKEKYYHEYVPEVMDSIQDLNEFRTLKLNGLWGVATTLEGTMLRDSSSMMDHLGQEVTRNLPHLDSIMYMRHNVGSFQEPADREFEPSPVWHDDATMVVDETAKIYLRNVLSKSKSQLGELRREVDKKRREVESVKKLKQRVRDGTENKDEVEVARSLFAMQEDLHAADRQRLTAEVETGTITAVVGDVTLGAKNHNFKGQTFKMPTNCDLCGERIWGLSAKGFDCRDCGYTCHSKCEMKVPADCPGEQNKDERKKLKAERQEAANRLVARDPAAPSHVADLPDLTRSNTMNSLSSHSAKRSVSGQITPAELDAGEPPLAARPSISPNPTGGSIISTTTSATAATGTRKRMAAPPPAAYVSELPGSGVNGNGHKEERKGKMLYAFEASGDGELSVAEGRDVTLLEADGTLKRHTIARVFFMFMCTSLLTRCRWLRLGQSAGRLQGRHRPRVVCRAGSAVCPDGHAARVDVLDVDDVVDGAGRQEEGAGGGAAPGCQEAEVRRGAVRVRGAECGRALHGGGGAVRARQGGSWGWVGGG